ncbi:MAG: sodium ion-translocating decarboxylase subunit beta, partial [Chloroflexota bacterium]|nr:sodium ion-translocating decarboxylase subunit beta [Chloroflexota bacterium]
VPRAAPLIGMFMFGNLMRECGVVERLAGAAQNELMNIVTILLGITVGSTMVADNFFTLSTIAVFALGIVAFVTATAAGVLLGKLMNMISGGKINPMIGAAGVSAVPMAARVVQKMASDEDPSNFILMHAMGPNVAGAIGAAVAGGVLLSLVN